MVHTHDAVVSSADSGHGDTKVTGWVGWVLFAGLIMITGGFFNAIEGVVALVRDNFYLVGSNGLVVNIDYTVYGWVLLLSGLVLIITGCAVMVGQTWARVTAVIFAVINAVLHMIFMPAYPLWSVIVITLDVFVIYALVVHGREAKSYKS